MTATEFLANCEKCKHLVKNTCWASMCSKKHSEPCFACADLKYKNSEVFNLCSDYLEKKK